jgi:hypothetical protein
MQTYIDNSDKLHDKIKSGELVVPTNETELIHVAKQLGWDESKYLRMRKSLFPTPEENAALSAKFMKMM